MSEITPVRSLVAKAKGETSAVTPQQAFDQAQTGTAILIDIRDIRELQLEGQNNPPQRVKPHQEQQLMLALKIFLKLPNLPLWDR